MKGGKRKMAAKKKGEGRKASRIVEEGEDREGKGETKGKIRKEQCNGEKIVAKKSKGKGRSE